MSYLHVYYVKSLCGDMHVGRHSQAGSKSTFKHCSFSSITHPQKFSGTR